MGKKKSSEKLYWLDEIWSNLEKEIKEADDGFLEPKDPWGIQSWNNLEESLLKQQGICLEAQTRAFQAGYLIGFIQRLYQDWKTCLDFAASQITDEMEEAWKRRSDGKKTFAEFCAELRKYLSPVNAFYSKAQRIASRGSGQELIDYHNGHNISLSTQIFNQKGLPAFGKDRASLNYLLSMTDIGAQILSIPRYVIDPERFHDLVTAATGSNAGRVSRSRKFLTDMKAPRRPRGRPKKSS